MLRHLTLLLSCVLLTNEANIKVMEKLRISCHGICYKAVGLQCDDKKKRCLDSSQSDVTTPQGHLNFARFAQYFFLFN